MSLTVDVENPIATITLDRRPQRNALDDTTMRALADAFAAVADDDSAHVVILTALGDKAFCAGVDLGAYARRPPTGPDDDWYALAPFMREVYPKPIIAAVNATAVGGGFELVLACDLIVAAEHAEFGIPEVKRGLIAAGGGTDLPRRLPMSVALEMGLTGERIDAARALALGLVNRVVPAEQVVAEARALACSIAANGPLAVRATKQLMYATVDLDRAAIRARVEEAGHRVGTSADALEGASAFVEKRAPRWAGR